MGSNTSTILCFDDTIPEIELTKYLKTYLAKYKVPKAFIRLKVYRTLLQVNYNATK